MLVTGDNDCNALVSRTLLLCNYSRIIWTILAPSKVVIHAWRLGLNRLLTMDNLAKRGVVVDLNNFGFCYFCQQEPETVNHIFFECLFSYRVWMVCCA